MPTGYSEDPVQEKKKIVTTLRKTSVTSNWRTFYEILRKIGITPNAGEDTEKWSFSCVSCKCEMATLEKSDSWKKKSSKHNTYLRSQQFHSWAFIPGRWELLFAQKPVRGVRSSFNSQKLGIQMPFSGWAAKQTAVHWAVDHCPGTKRSWLWGHAERTDLRGIRLSEETWSWNITHNVLKMRRRLKGCQGLEMEGGKWLWRKRHKRVWRGYEENDLYLDCGSGYMTIYICQKSWNCIL